MGCKFLLIVAKLLRKGELPSSRPIASHRKPPKGRDCVRVTHAFGSFYPVTSVRAPVWLAGGCRVGDWTACEREDAPTDFRGQCPTALIPRAGATCSPAFPLGWESKWSRRRRRKPSRRPHVVSWRPRFRHRVAQPDMLGPRDEKGAEGERWRVLGIYPTPCPQATQNASLGLGTDRRPSAGAGLVRRHRTGK